MPVLETIRRNPVAILAVVTAGLLGWIGANLLSSDTKTQIPQYPIPLPPPPVAALLEGPNHNSPIATLAMLPKVRPGMMRVEVEGILGPPPAEGIQPVTVTDGQVRYRASYDLAEPDAPMTIRPIRKTPLPPPPRVGPVIQVALEYDASKPGHPLVEIHYLDPLF